MPFHFVHGPAGSGKTNFILRSLGARQDNLNTTVFVLPNEQTALFYRHKVLENLNSSVITEKTCLSINDFFWTLLKQNKPRVHKASSRFKRNILRKALYTNKYSQLSPWVQFDTYLDWVLHFFSKLKKNGLTPQAAKNLFSKTQSPMLDELGHLFENYQNTLKDTWHYDEEDAVLFAFNEMDSPSFFWPKEWERIVFDRIFPFTPGEREIIKKMVAQNKKVTMAYSFDYTSQDDPYFYEAFTYLGNMAFQTDAFNDTSIDKKNIFQAHPHATSEVEMALDKIKTWLGAGILPNQIGVIVPPHGYYQKKLTLLCLQHKIPVASTWFCPVIEETDKSHDLYSTYLHHPSHGLAFSLKSQQKLMEFEQEWSFDTHLLFLDIPQKTILAWKALESKRLHAAWNEPCAGGIFISSVKEAYGINTEKLLVLGLNEIHSPSQGAPAGFYDLQFDPTFKEVFENPSYTSLLHTHFLKQAISRSTQAYISYPKINLSGKEQSPPLQLGPIEWDLVNPSQKSLHSRNSAYLKRKKKSFSISELGTYMECPYKYYARTILGLGEKKPDEVDVPADIRGRFVHRILEKLLKEKHDLFEEAIEYDLYFERLIQTAEELVDNLKMEDSFIASMNPNLRDIFCKKVCEALQTVLKNEIIFIRDKKKTCLPSHFEWSFGRGATPGLRIAQDIEVTGRIDRIDINKNEKTFLVVDYKTGDLESGSRVKKGEALQIPLYMMAVENLLFKNFRPAGGLLVGLKEAGKLSGIVLSSETENALLSAPYRITEEQWGQLKNIIKENVITIVSKINAGQFEPAPADKRQCDYCDYMDVCHIQETA